MSTTTPLTISQLQARCADLANSKGFHGKRRVAEDADLMVHYRMARVGALILTELGELVEEIRGGHPMTANYYPAMGSPDATYSEPRPGMDWGKPEGVPAEAADVLIRLLDWCGEEGIDLEAAVIEKMAYNETRAAMHGGKKA